MQIARRVAQLTRELTYANLDGAVVDRTKYLLLDFLGVAIRGSRSDSSQLVQRFLSVNHAPPSHGVPVIGTNTRAEASFAALANGTAAHSIELDDVVNAASLHPAVTVMPAALSAAYLSGCSGPELLEGIIAGYELTVKLGIALDPAAHYAQGFHPTGTCGSFGSALAAAKILKLDAEKTARALGIAGSQAAGSLEFLADGSFTKRLHAGWAAHAGLIAALLAREGFTGPTSIIEGRLGFLHAYSPVFRPEKVLHGWGDPYEIMRTSIKPHACCRYKQGPIDCILGIIKQNSLAENDIEKVVVSVLKAGAALVAEPRASKLNPQSIVDAQFSMPFGAAMAIIYGRAFLDQYCQENIDSPRVRDLMQRVHCVENAEIEKEFPRKWPAEVEILTRKGSSYRQRLEYPKGDPENPLSWDEIIDKFNNLASAVFSKEPCGAIVDRVRAIEEESDIRGFIDSLAAAASQ
ncbi:MAG: MmgE/PrpD family protein [Desulfobacteraceae bacterium]|nr:MAG: MmgE/PrpD family protein [Desulfobacteraceae bacterium]